MKYGSLIAISAYEVRYVEVLFIFLSFYREILLQTRAYIYRFQFYRLENKQFYLSIFLEILVLKRGK